MPYPSTVTTFTNPTPNDKLNSPSHSSIETAQNTGLSEIQTFVGTLSSAVGTLVYDIRSANSNGGGHVQTAVKGGTGQTSYTKGDLLVGQNTSTLTKFAVGATTGHVLKVDPTTPVGVTWGAVTLGSPTVRTYTSSVADIWSKPSNLSFVVVQVVGGGGAGGAIGNPSRSAGPGGGGAGYTTKIIPASAIGAAVSVRAGGGGQGSILSAGATGGLSYFGSLLSALGGQGGGQQGGVIENAGSGGLASILGDYQVVGNPGLPGYDSSIVGLFYSGNGGNSFLGGGAIGMVNGGSSQNGNSATGYGGGGGGATNAQGSVRGGHGGDGIVIVYEY